MIASLTWILASALAGGETPLTAPPTYSRDVAPILQRRCQGCHRPGQVGPFSLLSFDDAHGRAKMIATVLQPGAMPPWNADKRVDGVFVNQRSLSEVEKKTLLDWIAAGTARGNASEDPAPRTWPAGWSIGKPDALLTPDFDFLAKQALPEEGYAVPREGVVEYQYLTVKTNFPEDRWVRSFEIKAGSPDVVHHVLATLTTPGGNLDDKAFLATYVPGDSPSVYPDGYAKRLPKGATVMFQVHYTPNGKERHDKPTLAMVFAAEPPLFVVQSSAIMNRSFEIPPGAANFEVRAQEGFPGEVGLLSLMPHMHTRGKDMKIVAHFPDGKDQELLYAHYDFNWQESYILPDPLLLPAGTKLECSGHFDNAAATPNNPDQQAAVHWGDQTFEEMLVGFIDTVVPLE